MARLILSVLLLGLLALANSCHKRQVLVPTGPPAVAPSTPAASAPPPKPAPQEIPPPPALSPEKPVEAEGVIPTPQVGPPPAERPRRAARPSTPAGPAAPSGPATPSAPSAPAPQLGIVLSPDQQRQYNADIDQKIQSAEGNLRSIGNRQLSKEQQASIEETRNFIRQTQALRSSDLPGALRLAERAEVLARNLASSLR